MDTRNDGDFWFSFLVKIIFFEVIFIGFYIRKCDFFINMKENIFFFLYDFFRLFGKEFFAIDVFSDISRKALEVFLVSAGKIAVHFFRLRFAQTADVVFRRGHRHEMRRDFFSGFYNGISLIFIYFNAHSPSQNEIIIFQFIELV